VTIRPFTDADLPWAETLIGADMAGRMQARLGVLVDALACPGIVAEADGEPVGLLTYQDEAGDVEIAYLQASVTGRGIGTRLVDAVGERTGARRLWLVTTNDNLDALRFYQRRGFTIADVRPGALVEARRTLKPSIPEVGYYGIPIRDELILHRLAHR
jgi:ribosomal protein S18 acetylase RimI-like enzyme